MERQPYRDVVRTPFKADSSDVSVEIQQDQSMESMLFGDDPDPDAMREKLRQRDENLQLKGRMFQHVILERRLERYKKIASKKDEIIDDLNDVDLDKLSLPQKQSLLDTLNSEISRLEEDSKELTMQEQQGQQGDGGDTIFVDSEVNQQKNVENKKQEMNLDLSERKQARKALSEAGIIPGDF